MVKCNLQKPILEESFSKSTKSVVGVGVLGPLVTNGLQDSRLLAEQPGSAAAGLLEEKLLTHHKYTSIITKNQVICYHKSNPEDI